jgi:hypothetical protein
MKKISLCAIGLLVVSALCEAQPIPEGNTYPGPLPAAWGTTLTEMPSAQLSTWLTDWDLNVTNSYTNFTLPRDNAVGENLAWWLTPQLEAFYYGYMATGDPKYVAMLVNWTDGFLARAVTEPDGYPGWPALGSSGTGGGGWPVGDTLASYTADSMLGDAYAFRPIALMAYQMINNPQLQSQYGAKGQTYLNYAVNIYKKWMSRGGWQATTVNGVSGEVSMYMPQGLSADYKSWVTYSTNPMAGGMSHQCNKANCVARWMLAMYDVTGDTRYLTHARKWFTLMKSRMSTSTDSYAVVDLYGNVIWNYWEPAGPWDYDSNGAPIFWIGLHPNDGYYEVDTTAILEAWEHGVVFTQADIASLVHIVESDWTSSEGDGGAQWDFDPTFLQAGMSISVTPAGGTATYLCACFPNSLTASASVAWSYAHWWFGDSSLGTGALNGTIVSTTFDETTGTGTTVVQPNGGGSQVTITTNTNTVLFSLRQWQGTAPYAPIIQTFFVGGQSEYNIQHNWGELSTIPWWLMLQAELVLQSGSVEVTLGPAAAVTAGAQWNLDGGNWQNSGVTLSNVLVGSHTVNFNNAGAWSGPASAPITVTANATTSLTGTFTQQTGGLTITLAPAAVSAGAAWSVDGGTTWQSSGATVTGLGVGDQTVTYQAVAGWTAPASELVSISNGTTLSLTRTYVQQAPPSGSVQVTLGPQAAVTAGAEWNVDGGPWQASGATISALTPGVNTHTINYKTIANWNTPASVPLTITANTTTNVTGTYTAYSGSVTVTLAPAGALAAGAEWNVDGGAWQISGATVANIPTAGTHTVNYKAIIGWTSPSSAPVTITDNSTTSLTGTYVELFGSLTVTLGPAAAVTAGAKWSVDGGSTWQASGATISNLGAGPQTIVYKPVAAWAQPASQTVSISTNGITSITGTYVGDITPPAVAGEIPAPAAIFVGRHAPIALHITDGGSGVDLTTVQITASRDGGATSEPICTGLTSGATSYDASGNSVFAGTTYISGAAADYLFVFEPAAPFDYEETVTISVSASDLAGNAMTAPFSYSFTTETRSFGCNVRVDGGATGNDFPAAATDPNGNVWVAWERSDANGNGVICLAKRSDDGRSFWAEIPVTTLAQNGNCHLPAIAIGADGTIYLACQVLDANTGNSTVRVSSATTAAPTAWSSLGAVTASGKTLSKSAAIVVDSSGNLTVAAASLVSGVQQIAVGTLANGTTTWAVTELTSDAGNKRTPAVALDSSNQAYVVWAKDYDTNLYGADSSNWAVIHTLSNNGATAFSPSVAVESTGTIMHLVWMTEEGGQKRDILHASTGGGWPTAPMAGTSVLDTNGQGGLDAGGPRVAVVGSGARAKVFVTWEDGRYAAPGSEATDIFFAETKVDGSFGTNILVSHVLGTAGAASPSATNRAETIPALGVTSFGEPYIAWTDQPLVAGGESHVYFAGAMCSQLCGTQPTAVPVTTAGGTQTFTDPTNPHLTQVAITVPANALGGTLNLAATELRNPVVETTGGTGYFTDGSGVYLDISGGMDQPLNGWVTITVQLNLASRVTITPPVAVYRLAPPATALGSWTWTTDLIRNVSYNATTGVLSFQTEHLSSFGLGAATSNGGGGGGAIVSGGSSGGGGGGCAMSPNGEPDLALLLLPLAGLGLWAGRRLIGRKRPART